MFWHSFLCKGQCFPGVQGAPPLLLSWNSTRHTSIQKGIFQNSTASLIQEVSVAMNALKRSFPLTLSISFIDFFFFFPMRILKSVSVFWENVLSTVLPVIPPSFKQKRSSQGHHLLTQEWHFLPGRFWSFVVYRSASFCDEIRICWSWSAFFSTPQNAWLQRD